MKHCPHFFACWRSQLNSFFSSPYLLSLSRGDTKDLSIIFIQQNAGHSSKHFFEVLLQFGHVLAVANDLK